MTKKIISIAIIILFVIMLVNIFSYKTYGAQATSTLDEVMKGADEFVKNGETPAINQQKLKATSNFVFNVLLGIAMVTAVVVGMIIGIQLMTASVEEKAKVKEALLPYVVGCFVVFGAFGIWKLAVIIFSGW